MKTSKEYTNNLKAGIITSEMLGDALFSLNKRAKNARDKQAIYRNIRIHSRDWYDWYGWEDRYRERKEYFYDQKDKLLKLVKPICVHREPQSFHTDYDYTRTYSLHKEEDILERGEYYDETSERVVKYVIVCGYCCNYYLFYKVGNHSFHIPIDDYEVEEYELPIVTINKIISDGRAINDLMSLQFVKKILNLVESGKFVYSCN